MEKVFKYEVEYNFQLKLSIFAGARQQALMKCFAFGWRSTSQVRGANCTPCNYTEGKRGLGWMLSNSEEYKIISKILRWLKGMSRGLKQDN